MSIYTKYANYIGIYKLNFPNNKCYIGLSQNIGRRLKQHNYAHDQLPVHRAIDKYGPLNEDNVEILELFDTIDREQLQNRERYWIKYYNSNDENFGYNLTQGGDGASFGVNNLSDAFTDIQLEQVIDLLEHSDLFIYEIAEKFKVSPELISNINNGNTYFDITKQYPLRPPFIKSRAKSGLDSPSAKFTKEDIDEIYELLLNSTKSLKDIAQYKNISYSIISKINNGKKYGQENYTYPLRIKNRSANCKFDTKQLLQIYDDIINSDTNLKDLSKKYNCSYDTIRRINKGERYKLEGYKYPLRK